MKTILLEEIFPCHILLSLIWYLTVFISVGFAIVEKINVWKKILNIYIIIFLPFIGWIVYWIVRIYKVLKNRKS